MNLSYIIISSSLLIMYFLRCNIRCCFGPRLTYNKTLDLSNVSVDTDEPVDLDEIQIKTEDNYEPPVYNSLYP